MKYIHCKQGEPDWYAARCGRPTASRFADAISVLTRASGEKRAGDPTAAADKYAAEVAIEMISGQPWGEPISPWVLKRGHELEPRARGAYEARTGVLAQEAGVCLTDDEAFGYSTDGLVNPISDASENGARLLGCEGLIEIKCPVDAAKILTIWRTGDISEYFEQMQGGMWITGANWCDFIMYVPDLKAAGRDLFVRRVHRDDAFIATMEHRLIEFRQRALRIVTELRQAASECDLAHEAA